MTDFIKVADKNEIPLGTAKAVKLGDKDVMIANVNDDFYAINLKCSHAGGDLSKGQLDGNIVTCPKHHARFDVTNGKVVSNPKMGLLHPKANDVATFQVKVENDAIMIKL